VIREFAADLILKLLDIAGLIKANGFYDEYSGFFDDFTSLSLSAKDAYTRYCGLYLSLANYLNADYIVIPSFLKAIFFNKKFNRVNAVLTHKKFGMPEIITFKQLKKYYLKNVKINEKDITVISLDEYIFRPYFHRLFKEALRRTERANNLKIHSLWLDIFYKSEDHSENETFGGSFISLLRDLEDNRKILRKYGKEVSLDHVDFDPIVDIFDYQLRLIKFIYLLEEKSKAPEFLT